MAVTDSLNRRRHIRFKPDSNEFAQIDTSSAGGAFKFEFVGLIVEEAPMGGCSLITYEGINLSEGSTCRVKLGHLDPLEASVVWCKPEDSGLVRLGFRFES